MMMMLRGAGAVCDERGPSPLRRGRPFLRPGTPFLSQKVFVKLFFESQFPHKYVNLSFIVANMKDQLTDLYGN